MNIPVFSFIKRKKGKANKTPQKSCNVFSSEIGHHITDGSLQGLVLKKIKPFIMNIDTNSLKSAKVFIELSTAV